MTAVSKIDSNFTGLRFAVEDSAGVLPASPTWLPAEPNSYDKFGGQLKTLARNPINDGRQRKKGVIVDLDASAGFEMDVTSENSQTLMQSFLFAQARTNVELSIANVDATSGDYQPTSGGDDYFADNLLFAKNFTLDANNGLAKVVTATATSVQTDATTADENGASGIISRVGHEFASGTATIDVSGDLPKLVVSGIVAASQVLTASGNFIDGETVTVGGKTYTFKSTLTTAENDVKVAASLELSLTNLTNAINRDGVGTPATDFSTATTANENVTAVNDATTLTATAIVAGTPGNSIASTEVAALAAWGAATLAGGTGRSLLD